MEMLPQIFYDDQGRLHLFYHGLKSGVFNLFHAVEEENFRTTGSIITLTREMKGAFFPALHISGKKFFLVWQGKKSNFSDDLFFMYSGNYGESWSSPVLLTHGKGNASPSLLFYKGILYVTYRNNDGGNWSIKLLKAKGEDIEWDALPKPVSNTNADCFAPYLAANGDSIIITWYDLREKVSQIYSRQYDIETGEFLDEVNVSLGTARAENPVLIPVSNRVLLIWKESGRILGKNTDVYVPAPVLYSPTHPEGTWSRNRVGDVRWKQPADESGIAGYAVMVTKPSDPVQMREANPTIQNMGGAVDRRTIPDLDDGITYFHIRAIDGAGNWSRTVHFRLQTSITPLPVPLLISPSHPEPGKQGRDENAEFRWALDGRDRLKGFVYSLSKGSAKKPGTFTKDFSMKFPNLTEGNYFFTLAAVDKANQMGRLAEHYFIVGRAEQLDPNRIIELARIKDDRKKRLPVPVPSINIDLPFDPANPWEQDRFRAILTAKNIPESQVEGYSIYIGKEKKDLPERINHKSSIITIEGLKDGSYYIGARCRYYQVVAGKKVFKWTSPWEKTIIVRKPPEESPLVRYGLLVRDKLRQRALPVMVLLAILSVVTLSMGWGKRILFQCRSFLYRIRILVMLFVER